MSSAILIALSTRRSPMTTRPGPAKPLSQAVYALIGAGGVLVAFAAFLAPTGLIPALGGDRDQESLHLFQELGAASLLVGAMGLWCLLNYRRSLPVHGLLIVFFGAISVVHWLAYFRGSHPLLSGLLNTVPLLVLLVTWWLRRREVARA